MRRRAFITLLGGAAAAWPLAARAQQASMPVIGFLRSTAAAGSENLVGAFRQGLNEAGFVEGQNVAVEYRFAEDRDDRLPAMAAELVRRQVAVIVANGLATPVAKAATATIPIVFTTGFRSGQDGLRRQPQPARRQRHRRGPYSRRFGSQATGAVARARSQRRSHRRARGLEPTGAADITSKTGVGTHLRHRSDRNPAAQQFPLCAILSVGKHGRDLAVKRRSFITLLGGAAMVWPGGARAAEPAMPVIGFLDGQSFDPHLMTAFREGLKEAGYIEGRTVAIYFRSADGQTDRLVTLAGDIVGRRVAVIVTTGGGAAALAAYATTTTIPIVFVNGVDPVTSGLVMNLNRPGANATGVYILQQVLEGKRLGLLHGLVPAAALIAVLLNPTNANFQTQLRGVQDAARTLRQQVSILSASTERDIDVALATVTQSGAGALLVGSDPFFNDERDQVIALAARHAIPAIYEGREFAMAGGLASYGHGRERESPA